MTAVSGREGGARGCNPLDVASDGRVRPSLGFGGSGNSGMGRHHGIEGFREFSNPRGVVVRGEGDLNEAFFAPYGDTLAAITSAAFGDTASST